MKKFGFTFIAVLGQCKYLSIYDPGKEGLK